MECLSEKKENSVLLGREYLNRTNLGFSFSSCNFISPMLLSAFDIFVQEIASVCKSA